jgi:hypothetical protein
MSRIIKKIIWGICVEESTFVVEGAPKEDGVLKNILGFYGEKLLKRSIPIFLCPTSKGKELLRKEDLMEIESLLFNNELPHS